MKKLLFLSLIVFSLSTTQSLAISLDDCSAAFCAAHAGMVADGWDWNVAYDYLLPSYQVCQYGHAG